MIDVDWEFHILRTAHAIFWDSEYRVCVKFFHTQCGDEKKNLFLLRELRFELACQFHQMRFLFYRKRKSGISSYPPTLFVHHVVFFLFFGCVDDGAGNSSRTLSVGCGETTEQSTFCVGKVEGKLHNLRRRDGRVHIPPNYETWAWAGIVCGLEPFRTPEWRGGCQIFFYQFFFPPTRIELRTSVSNCPSAISLSILQSFFWFKDFWCRCWSWYSSRILSVGCREITELQTTSSALVNWYKANACVGENFGE